MDLFLESKHLLRALFAAAVWILVARMERQSWSAAILAGLLVVYVVFYIDKWRTERSERKEHQKSKKRAVDTLAVGVTESISLSQQLYERSEELRVEKESLDADLTSAQEQI